MKDNTNIVSGAPTTLNLVKIKCGIDYFWNEPTAFGSIMRKIALEQKIEHNKRIKAQGVCRRCGGKDKM